MILQSNEFLNNSAEIGGAIKLTKIIPPLFLESNNFNNNLAATYGDNYASQAYRILLLQHNSSILI